MHSQKYSQKRILAIDDQASVTNLWRIMLEKTGHYIVQEENYSRHAVQTARRFRPDPAGASVDLAATPTCCCSTSTCPVSTDRKSRASCGPTLK